MNFGSRQMKGQSRGSKADALAIKDAALRAVLDYLEYKNGPGEWFKDELAYRVHRMAETALQIPSEPTNAGHSVFRGASQDSTN